MNKLWIFSIGFNIVSFSMYFYLTLCFVFLRQIQPTGAYVCSLCNKPFKYKRSLQVHKKTHQGIYRYICPYCNKGCTSTAMLKGHIANKHTGVKEFKCSLCNEEFTYPVNLKTHMIRRHPESVSFQVCGVSRLK